MPTRIPFQVVYCSGADDGFSATLLEMPNPAAKGWQSQKFCQWPQLDQSGKTHMVIAATKVGLFVGNAKDGSEGALKNTTFSKLGHVKLSDNKASNFSSRELKSVHVDAVGEYIKLQFHVNHVNPHNIYNQVGLVALNILGDSATGAPVPFAPGHSDFNLAKLADKMLPVTPPTHPTLTSKGLASFDVLTSGRIGDQAYRTNDNQHHGDLDPRVLGLINQPKQIDETDDMEFSLTQDPRTAEKILRLKSEKQRAIQEERYTDAGRIKEAIEKLIQHGKVLGEMETKKLAAVSREDYEEAQKVKDEIDNYRNQIDNEFGLSSLLLQEHNRYNPQRGRASGLSQNLQNALATGQLPQTKPLPSIPSTVNVSKEPNETQASFETSAPIPIARDPVNTKNGDQPRNRTDSPPIPALQRKNIEQSYPEAEEQQIRTSSPSLPAIQNKLAQGEDPHEQESMDDIPDRFKPCLPSTSDSDLVEVSKHKPPPRQSNRNSIGVKGNSKSSSVTANQNVSQKKRGNKQKGVSNSSKLAVQPSRVSQKRGQQRLSDDPPPEMDDIQRSIASDCIAVFGEDIAKHIMSPQWANKADGLHDALVNLKDAFDNHDSSVYMRAIRGMLEQALQHKVKKVVENGLAILGELCELLEDHKTDESIQGLGAILQLSVPVVLQRTGEVASQVVEESLKLLTQLYKLDRWQTMGPLLAQISPTINWRKGCGRLLAIERVVREFGVSVAGPGPKSPSLKLSDVMSCIAPSLKHAKVEIREVAIRIVVACHAVDATLTERLWRLKEETDANTIKTIKQAIAKAKGLKPEAKKARKKLVPDDKPGETEEVIRLRQQLKAVKDAQKQVLAAQANGDSNAAARAEQDAQLTSSPSKGKSKIGIFRRQGKNGTSKSVTIAEPPANKN